MDDINELDKHKVFNTREEYHNFLKTEFKELLEKNITLSNIETEKRIEWADRNLANHDLQVKLSFLHLAVSVLGVSTTLTLISIFLFNN